MYVIFKTNGRQYSANKDEIIKVDKLDFKENSLIEFNSIMFLHEKNNILIGNPFLESKKIIIKIISHIKEKKIKIVKFKRRKHFCKIHNHRQWFTNIKIFDII